MKSMKRLASSVRAPSPVGGAPPTGPAALTTDARELVKVSAWKRRSHAHGQQEPPPRRTAKEVFRKLRMKGLLVGRLMEASSRAAADRYHVWVHREADDFLASFPFGAYVAETLRSFGLETKAESEEVDLVGAAVCIFLLSDNVFDCERSLSLMRKAVHLGKQCVLINMPGAKYGPERDRPFPENSFNPGWEPYCPELKPAFAEIAVTWEHEYQHACVQELLKQVAAGKGVDYDEFMERLKKNGQWHVEVY